MVSLVAGDDLHLVGLAPRLPVEARGLECRLVRLGATRREEDRLHVVIGDLHEALGQRDRRDVGRADVAGEVGELLHLSRGGVRQLGATVTHVHVPEAREAVDVFVPADVLHGYAMPADADEGVDVVDGMVQRVDQVLPIGLDELCGGQRHSLPLRFSHARDDHPQA